MREASNQPAEDPRSQPSERDMAPNSAKFQIIPQTNLIIQAACGFLAWSCKPAHEASVALAVLAIEVSRAPEVAIFIKEDYD